MAAPQRRDDPPQYECYNGGRCYPILEVYKGCNRVATYKTDSFCKTYFEPALK